MASTSILSLSSAPGPFGQIRAAATQLYPSGELVLLSGGAAAVSKIEYRFRVKPEVSKSTVAVFINKLKSGDGAVRLPTASDVPLIYPSVDVVHPLNN